jgi:hypothetical protein
VITLAAVTLVLLANQPPAQPGLGAVLRTNGELVARQEALRAAARDLSEQVCTSIAQGISIDRRAGAGDYAPPCPPPPSTDAGNEELLAWLSAQSALLEALATEPMEEAHLALDTR